MVRDMIRMMSASDHQRSHDTLVLRATNEPVVVIASVARGTQGLAALRLASTRRQALLKAPTEG